MGNINESQKNKNLESSSNICSYLILFEYCEETKKTDKITMYHYFKPIYNLTVIK